MVLGDNPDDVEMAPCRHGCLHSGPSRATRWAGVWNTMAALEDHILNSPISRTAEQVEETLCEVFSQDRVQQRLVKQMIEVRKVSRKDHIFQGPGEQILEFLEPR